MRKVLIADGAAGGRELLRILLEHEGYEVFEASDAAAALEIARATLPDLILLDMELPGDGYAAMQEMRLDERLKSRAIMAVTCNTRRADRERLVTAGFTGYIAKPVVMRVLREQLALANIPACPGQL
jgi:CheY-like chemotaxis protein